MRSIIAMVAMIGMLSANNAAIAGPVWLTRVSSTATANVTAKHGVSEELTYQYASGWPEYVNYGVTQNGSNVDFASRYAYTLPSDENFAEGQTDTLIDTFLDGIVVDIAQHSNGWTDLDDYLPNYNDIDNEVSYSSTDQYGQAVGIFKVESTTVTGFVLLQGALDIDATYDGAAVCIKDAVIIELGSNPDENGLPTMWTPWFNCGSTLGYGSYWSYEYWDIVDEELEYFSDVTTDSDGDDSLNLEFSFYAPVDAYIRVFVKSETIADAVVDDDSMTWYRDFSTVHNLSLSLTP